ncbi:MAG: class I SAM-dependent methyltransferase, partial [Pseudomonadota bacterium]
MHSAKFSSALEAPKFSDAGSAVQAHEARPAHTPYSPRRTSAQIAVLHDLVENAPNARKICGSQMIALCEELRSELGRPVRILDLGCGAVSSLAYLHHAGLADVVGVDADADAHATE